LSGVQQNFVVRGAYHAFSGGSGIGYVTNLTGDDALPVTNAGGLNYIYQGLTADGQQYVFLLWPMTAEFLPATVEEAVYEAEMIQTDRAGYYASLRDQLAWHAG
jgi:hypothetical protein